MARDKVSRYIGFPDSAIRCQVYRPVRGATLLRQQLWFARYWTQYNGEVRRLQLVSTACPFRFASRFAFGDEDLACGIALRLTDGIKAESDVFDAQRRELGPL